MIASIALTFLGLEVAVRLLGEEEPPLLVKDAVVGHRLRPGFAGRHFDVESGRAVPVRVNHLGYRGPDWVEEKPADVRRLVLLGDSFVAGLSVDEDETMAVRLEASLNRRGRRWEVLNLGVGGYSTAQSLLTWRHIARRFAPDVAVLCFYDGNDLWDNHRGLTTYNRPYFHLDENGQLTYRPLTAASQSSTQWLNDHSHLYVWQKRQTMRLREALRRARTPAPPAAELFNTDPPPPYPEAWRLSEALIAALADEVRASGAAFLLVSIPAHEEVMDTYWQRLLEAVGAAAPRYDRDHPRRRLAQIAEAHDIEFVPLVDAFRAAPDRDRLHFGGGHWNENGHRLAAEVLRQRVEVMVRGEAMRDP